MLKYVDDNLDSISNFEELFKEMAGLFDELGKIHPDTCSRIVDDAFNQLESKTANIQLKPIGSRSQTSIFAISRKIQVAFTVILFTSCLIIVGGPIFYDSIDDTVISSVLNNPYVQVVFPKEYSYQLGVFYMNLRSRLARIVRRYSAYLGSQHMLSSFGMKGNNPSEACFVPNPTFRKETLEPCSLCDGTEQVVYHSGPIAGEEDFEATIAGFRDIHVFEKSGLPTSLHILQQHISDNLHAIDLNQHSFESNISFVKSVKDLGFRQIISHLLYDMPVDGHIIWSTSHYTISRVMRQVFQRPTVIPKSISLAFNKAIMLDGPKSQGYKLPVDKQLYTLYIQGFGSRVIRFVAPADCLVNCGTHTVVTQAGDVLFYDALVWTAYSLPTHQHRSFAYFTHVSFDLEDQ